MIPLIVVAVGRFATLALLMIDMAVAVGFLEIAAVGDLEVEVVA